MIRIGSATNGAKHRARRRAMTAWRLYRLGGRRQPAGETLTATEAYQQLDPELAARAERFHNYGVTR